VTRGLGKLSAKRDGAILTPLASARDISEHPQFILDAVMRLLMAALGQRSNPSPIFVISA
jgi:hypothetical protein